MFEEGRIPIPPDFVEFDPNEAVRIYTRNLPHWRQEGVSYFVTFRLADSLPDSVWDSMQEGAGWWRDRMQREMSKGQALSEELEKEWRRFQRRYLVRLERELDSSAGRCLLRDPDARKVAANALHYFDAQRYSLYAFVVMPNHCHVAFKPYAGHDLEEILKSWKSFASRRINELLTAKGPLWQKDNFDRIIRNREHYCRVVRYILNNPKKARLRSSDYALYVSGRGKENEPPDSF